MPLIAEAGRRGPDVRSDCWMKLELRDTDGIQINLTSKVDVMYGADIRQLAVEVLHFFDIHHAVLEINDQGALPFVLLARLETVIKRCLPELKGEYLPPVRGHCTYPSARERFRRTRLYLPGNEPKFMINAGLHQPDGVILDLEDSVAPAEKDAARMLVRNALCQVDFGNAERMVRINQLPRGLDDLALVVPCNVHVILIPKCETPEQVLQVNAAIDQIKRTINPDQPVFLMPIIESALGVFNAYPIAAAAANVVALTIGLEDYTADIGAERTLEGRESFWARAQVVAAARAAKIQPIDTVFSDVTDMEGLTKSVLEAKALGFEGKGCIHPRQIPVIHQAFTPKPEEQTRAKNIVLAYEQAQANGLGVTTLGSKMIDPPVVKRALKTVELAIMMGILTPDWREGGVNHVA
ncbi:aldolase/citrate lyase family protein [candidate division KSB1 bacterium]|nr:aldolase/citrate lyase family protein [candidate division KSB1 bacterium]